jgi:hypothetical protein
MLELGVNKIMTITPNGLYRLTAYFMFYWCSLRHSDNVREYDGNMLVISNME